MAGRLVDLTLEYYIPNNRLLPLAPVFSYKVVAPLAPLKPVGTVLAGVSVRRLPNRQYILDFASSKGARYYVQYSSDNKNWTTVIPTLTGTGGHIVWLDNGPTKTISNSLSISNRFYKIIKAK